MIEHLVEEDQLERSDAISTDGEERMEKIHFW
jgi:hypothetical protein